MIQERRSSNPRRRLTAGGIFGAFDCHDDNAWPVFATFVQTLPIFVMPEIGVIDHEARLGRRNGHALFRIVEQGVEVIVTRIHFRRLDRGNRCVVKIDGRKAATPRLKALKLLIFIGWNEIAGNVAMARNGHCGFLRKHTVSTKIAGEFRSGDGFEFVHMRNIRILRELRNLTIQRDHSATLVAAPQRGRHMEARLCRRRSTT